MFWGSLLRAVTSIGQHVQREEWISLHLWGGGCSLAWLLVRQVEVCLSLGRQSTALGRKAYVSCRAGVQLCAECPFCDASLGVCSTNRQVLNSFTDTQEWVGQLTSCATLANQRLVNAGALYTLGTVSAAEQCSGISAPRAGCHTAPLSASPIREEAPELNHPCCGTGQPGMDPKSPSASRKGGQRERLLRFFANRVPDIKQKPQAMENRAPSWGRKHRAQSCWCGQGQFQDCTLSIAIGPVARVHRSPLQLCMFCGLLTRAAEGVGWEGIKQELIWVLYKCWKKLNLRLLILLWWGWVKCIEVTGRNGASKQNIIELALDCLSQEMSVTYP